jgi:hypothetical protein
MYRMLMQFPAFKAKHCTSYQITFRQLSSTAVAAARAGAQCPSA